MIALQILKVIGIILLVILCVVLVLLLIVLLAPIHYRVDGSYSDSQKGETEDASKEGEEKAEDGSENGPIDNLVVTARGHWIIHIFRFFYDLKGTESGYGVKFLWKEIYPGKSFATAEDDDEMSHFGKIKYKIVRVYDRIKQLVRKMKRILFILNDERDQEAVRELLFRVRVLLKHIIPRKGRLRVHFGMADPADTGQTLGMIYSLYPIYEEKLLLEPDFDEQVIDADIWMKGHVQLIFVVIAAARIYFNKDIRRLYRQIQRIRTE